MSSRELQDARLSTLDDLAGEFLRSSVLTSLFDGDQKTIGRFELRHLLGSGSMGSVFEAWDPDLERPVAIKVLHADATEASRRKLQREARALARVRHPNVVTVHEVLEQDRRLCLVMELLDGGSLRMWLRMPRSLAEIREAFAQSARGLAAAHAQGLVHRDFKPANVVIDTDGCAKVTDFGLAALYDESAVTISVAPHYSASSATPAGPSTHVRFAGTPHYAAPEQLAGEPLSAAADVYALCRALFEVLYDRVPPRAESLIIPSRARTGFGLNRARVPSRLRDILRAGLKLDPEERPTATEVADALAPKSGAAWWKVSAAALVPVALGVGVAVSQQAEVETSTCEGSAAEYATNVWNEDRAAAVTAAFTATGVPYADRSARAIDAQLQDFGERWASAREEVCRSTRVSGTRSDAAMERSMNCLDDAAHSVQRLVSWLEDADPTTVERADQMADWLPRPQECLATDLASTSVGGDVRADVEDALWAARLGRSTETLSRVAALADKPLSAADQSLLFIAEALAHRIDGRLDKARETLGRAWWTALRRAPRVASLAALERARLEAWRGAPGHEIETWIQNAEATRDPKDAHRETLLNMEAYKAGVLAGTKPADLDAPLRWREDANLSPAQHNQARMLHAVARLYFAQEKTVIDELEAVVETCVDIRGPSHPGCAEPMMWLYSAAEFYGGVDQEKLLDRTKALLGSSTSRTPVLEGWLRAKEGKLAWGAGRFEEGLQILQDLQERYATMKPVPPTLAGPLMSLAQFEADMLQPERALATLDRAEALTIERFGATDYMLAMVHKGRSRAHRVLNDWNASLGSIQRARAVFALTMPDDHGLLRGLDAAEALTRLKLGQPEAALPLAEKSAVYFTDPKHERPAWGARSYILQAEIHLALGDKGEAKRLLGRAIPDLDPPSTPGDAAANDFTRVAALQIGLGERKAARETLKRVRAVKLNPLQKRRLAEVAASLGDR